QQNEVGEFTDIHGAELICLAEEYRTVVGGDAYDLERRNACCDQQLEFALGSRPAALVRAACHDAACGMNLTDILFGNGRHDLHPPGPRARLPFGPRLCLEL